MDAETCCAQRIGQRKIAARTFGHDYVIGGDTLRLPRRIGVGHRVACDCDVRRARHQHHAVFSQFRQDAHPPHQRETLAEARGVIDHGHLPSALVEEFGQFDADKFAADDHDPRAQRHPRARCLAHQFQIGRGPRRRSDFGGQPGEQAGLALQRLRRFPEHHRAHVVAREHMRQIVAGNVGHPAQRASGNDDLVWRQSAQQLGRRLGAQPHVGARSFDLAA